MICKLINYKNNWEEVLDSARNTANKEPLGKEPSKKFKKEILKSEHSPIRNLVFTFVWEDLPYFVSVHLSRHKIGIEHFVSTSRTDRTGIDRNTLPQNHPVTHRIKVDAQALINISKVRLCAKASMETQMAWNMLLDCIKDIEPELYAMCVPSCIYRGHCTEPKSCGRTSTEKFKKDLETYQLTNSF